MADVQVYSEDGKRLESIVSDFEVTWLLSKGFIRQMRSGKYRITEAGEIEMAKGMADERIG